MRRFLRFTEVQKNYAPVNKATIYRWIAESKFPAPINLGGRAVAWNSEDLDAWMDARMANALHARQSLTSEA
jgi:prophage regulatory protein